MRFGEFIYLFIFGSIGLISVIARVIASKRKKKDEGAAPRERPSQKKAVETLPLTEFQGDENALRSVYRGESLHEEKTEDLACVERSPVSKEMAVSDNADLKDDEELAERPSPGKLTEKLYQPEYSSGITPIQGLQLSRLEPAVHPISRTDDVSNSADSAVRQNFQGISQEGRVYISAWETINQLSPMKRAIVLSEILGKPKGLE